MMPTMSIQADTQRDLYYLGVARSLADVVIARLADRPLVSVAQLDSTARDLKGSHAIDSYIHDDLKAKIQGLHLPASVYLESGQPIVRGDGEYVVFLDPIDGSTNCDRWVGDPGFVMAVARKGGRLTYGDLCFGFCQGLVSGDYYYTLGGQTYYYSAFHRRIYECDCRTAGVTELDRAVMYLNLGYGPGYGVHAAGVIARFAGRVADLRGFDNTAIEVCHIARNAAHLRVECRGGSDGANLLAPMTILKGAGGVVRRLDGADLDALSLDLDEKLDFVAGSNRELVDAALDVYRTK